MQSLLAGRRGSTARLRRRLLALVALGVAVFSCSGEAPEAEARAPAEAPPKPTPVVTTHPVESSLDDVFLEREATLVAVATAQISTRQDGFVRQLAPEVGDLLHEGDFIAQLDEVDWKLQLEEAQAELSRAEATLSEEKRAWARAQELFAGEVLSQGELDDRQTALDRALAEVEEARARVDRTRVNLEALRISAPMSGAITQLYTETGEYLRRGDRVAELKRIEVMIALCTVSERFLGDVHEGASVYVHVTAYPERVFPGLVWKIVPDALVQSRSFPVKVLLDNPDLALKPGMSARVSFVRRVERGLLLPKDAVLVEGDQSYVLVVEAGRAERRAVELGRAVGDRWHVRSGVTLEDEVVVAGNEDLAAGEAVQVVDLPPPGPPTVRDLDAPAAGTAADS